MPPIFPMAALSQLRAREPDPDRQVLLRGAYVITMDPGLGDVVGDIHIAGDRIARIGPGLAPGLGPDALILDAAGAVIIPGLVDCHVHAWEGQLRGIAPEADFGQYMAITHGGIATHMRPGDLAIGELITIGQAINAGVTTVIDNSHNSRTPDHSNAAIEALQSTGIRAIYAAGAALAGDHDHQFPHDLIRLRNEYFACPGGLTSLRLFDGAPALDTWRFAAEHDFGVCAEMGAWVTGLDQLICSGLMSEHHTYNHCSGLRAEAWAAIADSGAAVNVAPRSDSQFGLGGFIPILEVNRHGIQEGISSDNEVCYGQDMFTEMRTLMTVQRGRSFTAEARGDHDVPARYGPRDALRAATVGGAVNAGLTDAIGTLAPGKKADLVVLNMNAVHTRPSGSVTGTVVGFANASNVDTVFIDGVVTKFGGELTRMDYGTLAAQAETSREHLLNASGTSTEQIRHNDGLAAVAVR